MPRLPSPLSANQAAEELATALKEQPSADRIKLVGHTDVRGSAETNLKLSAARSEAVAAYLKEAGVSTTIETSGVARTSPWQSLIIRSQPRRYLRFNRRVEFIRR